MIRELVQYCFVETVVQSYIWYKKYTKYLAAIGLLSSCWAIFSLPHPACSIGVSIMIGCIGLQHIVRLLQVIRIQLKTVAKMWRHVNAPPLEIVRHIISFTSIEDAIAAAKAVEDEFTAYERVQQQYIDALARANEQIASAATNITTLNNTVAALREDLHQLIEAVENPELDRDDLLDLVEDINT